MQATSYVWWCIAYIPTPDFNIHSDFQMLLTAHIFHSCIDIVCALLKEAALNGASMTDAFGYICNCFTPLVAHIADLPEEQLIAYVAKNASPVTTATLAQFGDSYLHESHHGKDTLAKIKALCDAIDPWDITTFQKKAKVVNLLGVHLPYWRDWQFADPIYFLVGKLLHFGHNFFLTIR